VTGELKPGKVSGIETSFCIMHYPPKSKMTNTLLEGQLVASINKLKYKLTQTP
jgi:hypothetical protein